MPDAGLKTLPVERIAAFGGCLLAAAGVDADKAESVARLLALTDAMGRRTHGMSMLPLYLAEIGKGGMKATGMPAVVKDGGGTLVWDGDYLPGLWLVEHAIRTAIARIEAHGVVTVAIRRSHHIGCLAALVKQAADRGYVAIIANSDPAGKRVAPYGGRQALYTPNPFAIGYPGADHPVLVDTCASITTTTMTRQMQAEGRQFEHAWLIDAEGRPTRDPAVLEHSEPRGSLLPVGGLEYGHKGFALGLMIEALSQGLAGHGRADAPSRWGGNVFLQVLDPAHFAGDDAFARQTNHFSDACRATPPIDPARPVRVPGDQAAHNIARATQGGVAYEASTWSAFARWADKLGVALPD